MDFNVTLNLDDNLSQFRSLTFTKDLIDTYNANYITDSYYPVIDNSDVYYDELLYTRYPTFYNLSNLVYRERELTKADLYFIANNAYYMKGSIYSLKYALESIGVQLMSISYPISSNKKITVYNENLQPIEEDIPNSNVYNILLKTSVTILTGDINLIRDYINQLTYELLLCNSSSMSYSELITKFSINTEIIIRRTYINSNNLESSMDHNNDEGGYLQCNDEDYFYEPHFYYKQDKINFKYVTNIYNINLLNSSEFIVNTHDGIDTEFIPHFYWTQNNIKFRTPKGAHNNIMKESIDSDDYLVSSNFDYDPEFNF